MPHFIVEYTDNLAQRGAIAALLAKASAKLAAQNGVFPLGGIRARAIQSRHHRISAPSGGEAFVHATLKIGYGRTAEAKQKVFDELFDLLQEHFRAVAAPPQLMVSMELYEFDEGGTYKHNNVHARFRRAPPRAEPD
ncbi:MAG TPA: 5-carboxymethyl-2-hydroxymuconate isomerase [Steroidobacteraceae bacterium]|nr:5-carboxymethyl-2-hydroxymuconate isomerase [Steroidobacteraceae bacterium]